MSVTGQNLAALRYENAICDQFPIPNRKYKVDSSITDRMNRDYLTVNAANSSNETYLEFVISPSNREFINLENILLELKFKIVTSSGEKIKETDNITLIDGVGHSIISRCNVYLNGVPVENSTEKGLIEYVNTLLTSNVDEIKHLGALNFYKPLDLMIPDSVQDSFFDENDEGDFQDRCKDVVQTVAPLRLDIANSNCFLMDNVEIRIRLDLQPANYIILTDAAQQFKYEVLLSKLHVEKVIPSTEAVIGLNTSLITTNSKIEYIFERPVMKNYILSAGQNSFIQDNIFSGYVPSRMIIFFGSQNAMKGIYKRNPLYFYHRYANSIRIDINGQLHSVSEGTFPSSFGQFLTKTINSLGRSDNLLTFDNFAKGRTIFAYDLASSNCEDCLPLDSVGNLRVNIQFSQNLSENIHVYILGYFPASVRINANRAVESSFLL